MSTEMRALFLGMSSPFSHIVLEKLLSADLRVVAVLLSGQRFRPLAMGITPDSENVAPTLAEFELPLLNPKLPLGTPENIYGGDTEDNTNAPQPGHEHSQADPLRLAWQAGIPVYECGDVGHPEVVDRLAEMALDVACVACWHRVIPQSALDIPQHGFLNVHPSLLPAYRGPQPLFWQFRAGETCTGVTVHWMDTGMDTGDIAAQRKIRFADGIRAAEAEARCASAGGDLLAETLIALAHGKTERKPQHGGSYFPAPTPDDFALDTNWPVRRAFNFVCASAAHGIPFRVNVDGAELWLRDALAWQVGEPSASPFDGGVCVRFGDGTLWAEACPVPLG